jgi:hypothetical protein
MSVSLTFLTLSGLLSRLLLISIAKLLSDSLRSDSCLFGVIVFTGAACTQIELAKRHKKLAPPAEVSRYFFIVTPHTLN